MDQTSVYQVAQEHVGEDRPLLSIIMEATSDEFTIEDWKYIRMLRLSNLQDDVEGIIETMESISANGINYEEVGQNLKKVESMKQKVQDSLDEFMAMIVNGNYEEERPEQFGEVAELVAKVKADFGPFQLEMVEERNACMFTPHRMPGESLYLMQSASLTMWRTVDRSSELIRLSKRRTSWTTVPSQASCLQAGSGGFLRRKYPQSWKWRKAQNRVVQFSLTGKSVLKVWKLRNLSAVILPVLSP